MNGVGGAKETLTDRNKMMVVGLVDSLICCLFPSSLLLAYYI